MLARRFVSLSRSFGTVVNAAAAAPMVPTAIEIEELDVDRPIARSTGATTEGGQFKEPYPLEHYIPQFATGIVEGGVQDLSRSPNATVQKIAELEQKLNDKGHLATPAQAGLSEKDLIDLLAYDHQCLDNGQTLLRGVPAAIHKKVENEFNVMMNQLDVGVENMYGKKAQEVLAEDYLLLTGQHVSATQVSFVSFPLTLAMALGMGVVFAFTWISWTNGERHRVHHAANAWRLEGPQAPELTKEEDL